MTKEEGGENFSIAPDGTKILLPTEKESEEEFIRVKRFVAKQREKGRKIVIVQGAGFVGGPMSAIVADTVGSDGKPIYACLNVQRPSQTSFWKIPVINRGETPFKSEDPELSAIYQRTALEKRTLTATWVDRAFSLADIVVVDIQLDAIKPEFNKAQDGYCDLTAFKEGIRTVASYIEPNVFLLIETTVPPGTCKKVVRPIMVEEFQKRGIDTKENPPRIAHSYERVMPGRNYIQSIRNYPRVFAGVDEASAEMAREFLSTVIQAPLTQLRDTTSSELAKLIENTKRAIDIAFANKLAPLAEAVGVNLFEIIDAIRMRTGTHDNICQPSLGVGGYCLPKDPILLKWGIENLLGLSGLDFSFATEAVNTNDLMPAHTFEIIWEALNSNLRYKKIVLLGGTYIENVGDDRYAPSKTLWKLLRAYEVKVVVLDSLIKRWSDIPEAKIYPYSEANLQGADAVVFAKCHTEHLNLCSEIVVRATGGKPLIVDCSNYLSDETIRKYLQLGCQVRGVGKGHIQNLSAKPIS